MTTTDPRDRETVRNLLRQHLPSGFPPPLAPLTVGAVANYLLNEWNHRRLPLLHTDVAITRALVTDQTPMPADLSGEAVHELLASLGVEDTGLLSYWRLFRDMAGELILERGRNLVLPHPRAF